MVNAGSLRPRALFRGGNANNAANAGLGYVNANNVVGNSNTNIGARLSTSHCLFCISISQHPHKVNHLFSEA
jgi:hypothetical protein